MKIQLHLQDPEGIQDSLRAGVVDTVLLSGLTEDEIQPTIDKKYEEALEAAEVFIESMGCLVVELDTLRMTARVVPQSEL